MKIKICTVHYCGLSDVTRRSVEGLKGEIDFFHVMAESTYIAEGRNVSILNGKNSLVRPKLEEQYSHYLMLDSDIGFSPAHIQRLLAMDVPIASGVYESRSNPGSAVCGWWGTTIGNIGESIEMKASGQSDVDWCGAGFLLVKREVLEKMPYPWFCHEWVEYEEDGGVQHRIQAGEDASFCLNAAKAGYKVVVDCDCKVAHGINKGEAYGNAGKVDPAPINAFQLQLEGQVRGLSTDIAFLCDAIRSGKQLQFSEKK